MPYTRNTRGQLIVKRAWALVSLPTAIVIELPDGSLKMWGVRMSADQPRDNELREYKGYHPEKIPTAHQLEGRTLWVYGLDLSEGVK